MNPYRHTEIHHSSHLLLFWHTPLGVRSTIRRHQPPQRKVLGQVDCFIQCEVVGSQIALDGVQPHDTRMPWWSLPAVCGGAIRIILASVSSSICAICPPDMERCRCDIYDTRRHFTVRSKADMSQLNLPHGNNIGTYKTKYCIRHFQRRNITSSASKAPLSCEANDQPVTVRASAAAPAVVVLWLRQQKAAAASSSAAEVDAALRTVAVPTARRPHAASHQRSSTR